MRLHPQQTEIQLYETGFEGDDILQRGVIGKGLSDLLERIDDPIVLAVDGPWGSGKSHFLKRWVGGHKLENGGIATTVYFDAFANDYLDDPLIGLTGAIGERLPSGSSSARWKKAKTVAMKLARPALRIGAAIATAGATELTGPIVDAAIEAGGKTAEEAAEAFWRREDGRRGAMRQFKTALGEITKDGTPLIIVVDELDRCRPDYALSVLEVIKHFFAVEKVHFVLGVNLEALEAIVCVRYGAQADASDYLKRFISLSIQLPDNVGAGTELRAQIHYLRTSAMSMGIDNKVVEVLTNVLELAIARSGVSLRDIERILTRVVLLPGLKELQSYKFGYQYIILTLVIWQVLRPSFFRAAINRTLPMSDIESFFGISEQMLNRESDLYNHGAYLLSGLWRYALTGSSPRDDNGQSFARSFDDFGRVSNKLLANIERDFFNMFKVAD